jgi:hypothetical protein
MLSMFEVLALTVWNLIAYWSQDVLVGSCAPTTCHDTATRFISSVHPMRRPAHGSSLVKMLVIKLAEYNSRQCLDTS